MNAAQEKVSMKNLNCSEKYLERVTFVEIERG